MTAILVLALASVVRAADPVDWIAELGGKVELGNDGQVVSVNLRGSWISDYQMWDLARMPKLERLDLSHTRISDEGMLHLKAARGIRDLNLFYSEWITDQGMVAIRDWKQLKRLNVRGTRISDGTLQIVAKLTGLEVLDIANTQITDNGLDHLITLTNLRELSIGRGRLTDGALEVLRLLPTLTYLDLGGARAAIPDMGRRRTGTASMSENMVRAIGELKDLRTLKLGYSNIGADGLKMLATSEKVEKLGLEGCTLVDDAAAAELANWKSLKYVDLQATPVSAKAVEALKTARPGMVILFSPPVKTAAAAK